MITMTRFHAAVLLIAAVILIATMSGQTRQPKPSAQPGRYQLFAGEYATLGAGDEKVILRLDTQTGNVDQWVNGQRKNGDLIDSWMRLGQMPGRRP